jgi:hypothetical protein
MCSTRMAELDLTRVTRIIYSKFTFLTSCTLLLRRKRPPWLVTNRMCFEPLVNFEDTLYT